MQSQKRAWIYSGLALPKGVGLVRPAAGILERRRPGPEALRDLRVALVGDELAEGLERALCVLFQEAGALMEARCRRGSTVAAWVEEGWLADVLAARPAGVLAAFTWGVVGPNRYTVPTGAMRVAQEQADALGARIVWVAPPTVLPDAAREVRENVIGERHGVLTSEGLDIQLGPDGASPTVLGYAGWAGAVWRQFESGV
jgi:hypothetical protein